ncbi:hypothetical protein G6F68_010747 [Rhizopus microsporus]|nr:hypothetical protein G6F68_010747 [Rhizopus microsporus]
MKVRAPSAAELPHMKPGTVVVGMLDPFDAEGLEQMAGAGLGGFALEAAPRITRAQSLDVLSSQANLAGYKADFLRLFGFGVDGVDYEADVNPDVRIENLVDMT